MKNSVINFDDKLVSKIKMKNSSVLIWGFFCILFGLILLLTCYPETLNTDSAQNFSSTKTDLSYSKLSVKIVSSSLFSDDNKDTFHLVSDGLDFYIVKLGTDEYLETEKLRDYTNNPSGTWPASVTLYGTPVAFTDDVISKAIDYYNSYGLSPYLTLDNFSSVFGDYYLDTTVNSQNNIALLAFAFCVIETFGLAFILIYLVRSGKVLTFSIIFFIGSWFILLAINMPDDFENDSLLLAGLYFVVLATIVMIYFIVKNNKKGQAGLNVNSNNAEQINNGEIINNVYLEKTDDEILQSVYDQCEKFFEAYSSNFAYCGGHNLLNFKNEPYEKQLEIIETTKAEFVMSLFVYILLQASEKEHKKAVMFLRNIDAGYLDEIKKNFGLSNDGLKKALEETDSLYAAYDYREWRKSVFYNLSRMRDYDWDLKEEEFIAFLTNLQNAYNAYVSPEKDLDLIGEYTKTSVDNAKSASTINIFAFWLPLVLIILMVICFFIELFSSDGEMFRFGWWSVAAFIILVIWAVIGNNGRINTCPNCKKWGALKLEHDYIIDSYETWRTKTITENARNYTKQVAVRIDKHEEHYVCQHCGKKETRYRETETQL